MADCLDYNCLLGCYCIRVAMYYLLSLDPVAELSKVLLLLLLHQVKRVLNSDIYQQISLILHVVLILWKSWLHASVSYVVVQFIIGRCDANVKLN